MRLNSAGDVCSRITETAYAHAADRHAKRLAEHSAKSTAAAFLMRYTGVNDKVALLLFCLGVDSTGKLGVERIIYKPVYPTMLREVLSELFVEAG